MSECLATMISGNYALAVVNELGREGYRFMVMPTPCRIARAGCGHCIRLPEEHIPVLRNKCNQLGYAISEIYRIVPENNRSRYVRIYPS